MDRSRHREDGRRLQPDSWLFNVGVAGGWLLLVTAIGTLLTPHHLALAHGATGKIAAIWVFIVAISWLGAQSSRLKKAAESATAIRTPDHGRKYDEKYNSSKRS